MLFAVISKLPFQFSIFESQPRTHRPKEIVGNILLIQSDDTSHFENMLLLCFDCGLRIIFSSAAVS